MPLNGSDLEQPVQTIERGLLHPLDQATPFVCTCVTQNKRGWSSDNTESRVKNQHWTNTKSYPTWKRQRTVGGKLPFRRLRQTGLVTADQYMPFGSPLVRIRKVGHQLKGWDMGKQAKEVCLPLLDGVNKEDLQQGKIQIEQHI